LFPAKHGKYSANGNHPLLPKRLGEVEWISDRIAKTDGGQVFVERRKSERRPFQGPAKIQFGVGTLPRDCMIADVSDGGVRIVAENLVAPPEFTLILPAGRPRLCRVAWRIGCEFGAEFIDHPVAAPERHSSPRGRVRVKEYA
jgi:hypothetical protein